MNDYIQTLIYCKYTGSAIAKVWAGQAHLPTRDTMWSRFWDQVHARGGLNEQLQWLVNLGMYCESKDILILFVGLTRHSPNVYVHQLVELGSSQDRRKVARSAARLVGPTG